MGKWCLGNRPHKLNLGACGDLVRDQRYRPGFDLRELGLCFDRRHRVPGNQLAGPVGIINNGGGVSFSGNTVAGPTTLTGYGGGFYFEGNTITGPLVDKNNS